MRNMYNILKKPVVRANERGNKKLKRAVKGLIAGCAVLTGLLAIQPQDAKAATAVYVSNQDELNVACNDRGEADIYLTNDITLAGKYRGTYYPTGISVYGNKTIHGNGHAIRNELDEGDEDFVITNEVKNNGVPVFNVANTLTVQDVVINGGNSEYRSAIVVSPGGMVNIQSGTYITGCKSWTYNGATRGGHGIWCREGGVINVYDGSIYGNEQSGIGSSGGTVSVAGGNIYNNGNNGISSYGTLYFHGGTINQNANCGIYVGDGRAYINGGLIAGNRSEASAGIGIQKGDVVMNGGTVNNLSQTGVYLLNGNGTFTMNAGEINGESKNMVS